MQGINQDLFRFLAKRDIAKKYYDQLAIKAWNKVVGPEIACNCQPLEVKGSVMLVVCAHSMWIQELSLRKKEIIRNLKKVTGKNNIQDIRFVAGEVPEQAAKADCNGNKHTNCEAQLTLPDLNEEEKAWIQDTVKHVTDETLQQKIAQVMRHDLKVKKQLKANGYQACGQCGVLTLKQKLCSTCEEEKNQLELNQVLRLLRESPWLDYETIKSHLPAAHKSNYHKAKTLLYKQITDQLNWLKKVAYYHPEQGNQAWMKDLLNQLVLLVMETPPESLPEGAWDKVVEANCPEYFQLFDSKSPEKEEK